MNPERDKCKLTALLIMETEGKINREISSNQYDESTFRGQGELDIEMNCMQKIKGTKEIISKRALPSSLISTGKCTQIYMQRTQ